MHHATPHATPHAARSRPAPTDRHPAAVGPALVPALALVLAAGGAGAQAPAERAVGWGGVGVGLSSVGGALHLDLARYRAPRLLRARLTAHSNLGGAGGAQRDESVTEVSALVGRGAACCGGNWGAASVGGGLVLGRLGSDAAQFATVGLAGDVVLVSRRRPHLAFAGFANLNPKRSFAGISLSLVLGRPPFAAF